MVLYFGDNFKIDLRFIYFKFYFFKVPKIDYFGYFFEIYFLGSLTRGHLATLSDFLLLFRYKSCKTTQKINTYQPTQRKFWRKTWRDYSTLFSKSCKLSKVNFFALIFHLKNMSTKAIFFFKYKSVILYRTVDCMVHWKCEYHFPFCNKGSVNKWGPQNCHLPIST